MGETYLKWMGAIHLIPWWRTGGVLYLTNQRLLFLPMFWHVGRPILAFYLGEIEDLGDDRRPGYPFLLLQLDLWFLRPWYLRARGEEHYFSTSRADEWLTSLSDASGIIASRRNV